MDLRDFESWWLGGDQFFQDFGLIMSHKSSGDFIQIAFHNTIQLIEGQIDSVIRQTILRKVVSADFFTAVPGTHLIFAVGGNCVGLLFLSQMVQPGPKHLSCFGAVLVLRTLILAADNHPRRQMRNPNSRM